jgi:hypothetical protein
MPFSPAEAYRHFGGKYCTHLQGQRESFVCSLFSAVFLFGLLFGNGHEGSKSYKMSTDFHQTIRSFIPENSALQIIG